MKLEFLIISFFFSFFSRIVKQGEDENKQKTMAYIKNICGVVIFLKKN